MRTFELASAWTLGLLPAVFIAWVCATGPEIPHSDYWGYLHDIVTPEGFSSELSDWTARTLNQLLTGAYLIYALNLVVTGGSNRGLALVSWLFAAGILALFAAWSQRSLDRNERGARWATVGASWMLFSPLFAAYWIMGFQGVAKLGSVLASVAAIHCWVSYGHSGRGVWLLACITALAIGLSFFPAAIALVPLLMLATALRVPRDGGAALAFLAALALLTLAWGLGYDSSAATRPPAVGRGSTASLLLYPFCLLGSPFSRHIEVGLAVGLLGVATAAALGVRTLRAPQGTRRGVEIRWWLLMGFAAGNTLLTTVARGSMGLEQAFASRYAIFPVLFWISLGALSIIQARRTAQRWIAAGVLCIAVLASHANGWTYYQALRYRSSLEPATRIALRLGLLDPHSILGVVAPGIGRFVGMVPTLRAQHWIPFEHGGLGGAPTRRAPIVDAQYPTAEIWAFRAFRSPGRPQYRLAGRLPHSLGLGTELLLFNRSGRGLGRAAVVPAASSDQGPEGSSWIGYLSLRGVQDVYITAPAGDVLAALRCCDAAQPLAKNVNPYESPYPFWYRAGKYRSAWLRSLVARR
jgi:hypothetical protein